ncbi:uncharacterized protein B0I36DRAFT_158852 [Microdochium trichocladiopsis]|uniref:Uncharacterized protein n=1 Tax=Microdochium trichocladiopsis TaxID=1682393 RepID=A0A9P8XZA3_9PEZI|nr:uncharacterized protein B0I36DRAFT_158852 [Microdochium trichocladiopsis]KAH7026460.1 hypothetical protein B0I36DRAFT_158852 [Microdochium trichocladiopsis]
MFGWETAKRSAVGEPPFILKENEPPSLLHLSRVERAHQMHDKGTWLEEPLCKVQIQREGTKRRKFASKLLGQSFMLVVVHDWSCTGGPSMCCSGLLVLIVVLLAGMPVFLAKQTCHLLPIAWSNVQQETSAGQRQRPRRRLTRRAMPGCCWCLQGEEERAGRQSIPGGCRRKRRAPQGTCLPHLATMHWQPSQHLLALPPHNNTCRCHGQASVPRHCRSCVFVLALLSNVICTRPRALPRTAFATTGRVLDMAITCTQVGVTASRAPASPTCHLL